MTRQVENSLESREVRSHNRNRALAEPMFPFKWSAFAEETSPWELSMISTRNLYINNIAVIGFDRW
jgi:hypothetical protein